LDDNEFFDAFEHGVKIVDQLEVLLDKSEISGPHAQDSLGRFIIKANEVDLGRRKHQFEGELPVRLRL